MHISEIVSVDPQMFSWAGEGDNILCTDGIVGVRCLFIVILLCKFNNFECSPKSVHGEDYCDLASIYENFDFFRDWFIDKFKLYLMNSTPGNSVITDSDTK